MVLPLRGAGVQSVVVDDVMYLLGRNSSLIALDATSGKEIWIHEGLGGIVSRGINYWQSADGKDKRLLFSINSYLQAIDATTGKSTERSCGVSTAPTWPTSAVISKAICPTSEARPSLGGAGR